jgi:hypothetical protein
LDFSGFELFNIEFFLNDSTDGSRSANDDDQKNDSKRQLKCFGSSKTVPLATNLAGHHANKDEGWRRQICASRAD